MKEGIADSPGDCVPTKLHRFLLQYRITHQSITGKGPAELGIQRRLQTTLELLHPDLQVKVQKQQSQMKMNNDKMSPERTFAVGDRVNANNCCQTVIRGLWEGFLEDVGF